MNEYHDKLVDIFLECCPAWTREQADPAPVIRFAEAYLMMAEAGYRPGAPGDGCGHVHLTVAECRDRARLFREAIQYAVEFCREEDGDAFIVGCSDYPTNRAFMLAIEAARVLAAGEGSVPLVCPSRLSCCGARSRRPKPARRGHGGWLPRGEPQGEKHPYLICAIDQFQWRTNGANQVCAIIKGA
jgi:hypothetical protein